MMLPTCLAASLAFVALYRRLVLLPRELRARARSQQLRAADGARLARRVAPRSRLAQALLSLLRCGVALGVALSTVLMLTARNGISAMLFTLQALLRGDAAAVASSYGVETLALLVRSAAWFAVAVVVLEQWWSALPIGRSVRVMAVVVGTHEAVVLLFGSGKAFGACDVDDALVSPLTPALCALSRGLVLGFAALAVVCQFAGEYHLVGGGRGSAGAGASKARNLTKAKVMEAAASSRRSLRVVFLTVGTRGDVQPFVALGTALLKMGHRPVIVTHRKMESFVTSHGIEFRYCGVEFDQHGVVGKAAESASIYAWFREALRKVTLKQYTNVNTHFFAACSGKGENATDLIVSTGHTVGPAMDFAEKLGLPMWCCQLTPHQWPTRSFGPHSHRTSCCGCLNLLRHYAYWGELSRAYSEANVASHAHAFRSNVLGLRPADPGVQRVLDMFEVETYFVAARAVVPQPMDWPVPSNVCGFFFLDQEDYTPPAALTAFLKPGNGRAPVVCINFGSMVLVERTNFIRDAAMAAIACGKRVLLITGWASPPEDLPEGCFCVQSVPHEWVFDKCCAVIHHGGAGTTARVLQAGVPSVIVPILIGTDQPWWADRVEELDCGVHVRGATPGHKEIQEALGKVVSTKSEGSDCTRLKARREALANVAACMRMEDGVLNFVAAVNRLAENMPPLGDAKRHGRSRKRSRSRSRKKER
jgi:sterol 3beta-glucosyltransferase